MQVVPLLGQRSGTAVTLHRSRAAFEGLTAMMTHHPVFLRNDALRLTCGSRGRLLSRYKRYRKTPTHRGLLCNFPTGAAVTLSPDVSLLFLPSQSEKVLCHHWLCVSLRQRKSSGLKVPSENSFNPSSFFWTLCFVFWSQTCSCSWSSGVGWAYQLNRNHKLSFERPGGCVICWNVEDFWCRMTSAIVYCVELSVQSLKQFRQELFLWFDLRDQKPITTLCCLLSMPCLQSSRRSSEDLCIRPSL